MDEALVILAQVTDSLRTLLLAGGIVFAVTATVDWAVRTRRISPFSGVALFMRARVAPRIAGVERQVARVGGHPASTPWCSRNSRVPDVAITLNPSSMRSFASCAITGRLSLSFTEMNAVPPRGRPTPAPS